VSVDNVLQIDITTVRVLLQHWKHLGRVCGVNDHGILGFVVDDEVSVVVAATLPFCTLSVTS